MPRDTEGEGIMAHLLLIDDDPALIPKLVCQVFPGPAHRVEVAGTGAEGLERAPHVAIEPSFLLRGTTGAPRRPVAARRSARRNRPAARSSAARLQP